ncbi:C-type lectin domain family 17, member A-like [Engraulis encrasicolus]|uniref:C-type lectin domain family 17, member A-like n=1 Tax=Engraulis encrasicolus TaxID=184585 RepID=UPI002FD0F382
MYQGEVSDLPCNARSRFVCYDEAHVVEDNKYVYITELKSWSDAQSYCRHHYTDLAIARNSADYLVLTQLSLGWRIWIGLYRGYWEWSDQNPATFRAWQPERPSIPTGKENCAYYQDGGWVDSLCSEKKTFICNGAPRSQVVRIAIKMDSPVNMEDPAIQAALAEQIRQKLQQNGQPVGRIAWKSQPDGKVFHQQKNEQTRKKREKKSEL